MHHSFLHLSLQAFDAGNQFIHGAYFSTFSVQYPVHAYLTSEGSCDTFFLTRAGASVLSPPA